RTTTPATPRPKTGHLRAAISLTDILTILNTTPDQPRKASTLGRQLGLTDRAALHSLTVRLSQWADQGRLTKTAPGTYTITTG
ncbi:hypothetical protein, partial [Catenulispora pinisilvae]|uniref:hypothetical protein n=1 Tax=Catenulispora pinisilvae TaxID=2705253 RepID=UPI001E544CA2